MQVGLGSDHIVLDGDPDFPTSVARHSRSATQWYRLLLLGAYDLATVHALLCIVNGDDLAVFRFLSLVT